MAYIDQCSGQVVLDGLRTFQNPYFIKLSRCPAVGRVVPPTDSRWMASPQGLPSAAPRAARGGSRPSVDGGWTMQDTLDCRLFVLDQS
jgi:hypothetical protein